MFCCCNLPALCIRRELTRVKLLNLCTLVVLGSMVFCLQYNWNYYSEERIETILNDLQTTGQTTVKNGIYEESPFGTACKMIITITTLVQLYVLTDLYSARARAKGFSSIWAAGFTRKYLIEFIVNAIHIPPFMAAVTHTTPLCEIDYLTGEANIAVVNGNLCKPARKLYRMLSNTYDELNVFTIMRLYHLARWMHQRSPLHKVSTTRSVDMRDLEGKTGVRQVSMFFVLRCYFQQKPWMSAWYLTGLALFSFAYIVYCFERVINPEDWGTLFGVASSLYWAAITMTSTGYGDFVPVRLMSRIVTAGSALVGLLLSATFVFAMMKSVQLKPTELNALKWLHDKIHDEDEKRYVESNTKVAVQSPDASRSPSSMRKSLAHSISNALRKSPAPPQRFSFLDPNLETLNILKEAQKRMNQQDADISAIKDGFADIKRLLMDGRHSRYRDSPDSEARSVGRLTNRRTGEVVERQDSPQL